MAIMNAMMGSGVALVPAGKTELYLQWTTEDGQNLSGASFTIQGPTNTTVLADASGRAKALVDAGTYTVAVTHSGQYRGAGTQTVQANSTEQAFVFFYGAKGSALDAYPVGSIYMSVNATNPSTLLGGGTWERIAQGRTLIGQGTSDQTFSAGSTGGTSTVKLTTSQIPAHTHNHTPEGDVSLELDEGVANMVSNARTDTYSSLANYATGSGIVSAGEVFKDTLYKRSALYFGALKEGWSMGNETSTAWAVEMKISPTGTATLNGSPSATTSTGGGGAHNNLPPYLVCYIWQRTA